MNFLGLGMLTPLYALGALTILGPLIFHLIRRTPREETRFSSLMFLAPSPPRLTRRSRLDNLFLLLLRALALILISIAFTRPFQRVQSDAEIEGSIGRRTLLLVDRSASMRREGIWEQVIKEVDRVLDDGRLQDQFALMVFDQDAEPLVSFEDGARLRPQQQQAAVRKALSEVELTWSQTKLDHALVLAADVLEGLTHGKEEDVEAKLEILLISDMQSGASIEALQSYEWPKSVTVAVKTITPENETNVGISLLETRDEELHKINRVRVQNSGRSDLDNFEVKWSSETTEGTAIPAYVPAGQTKVYRLPDRDADASRVIISGDEVKFDNTIYVAPIEQKEVKVLFVGNEPEQDAGGASYYLKRAFLESPYYRITVQSTKSGANWPDLAAESVVFVVVGGPVSDSEETVLQRYMETGGVVLVLANDESQNNNLRSFTSDSSLKITKVKVEDYRLFAELNDAFPPFAELKRLQFADLTQVHIWQHRSLKGKDFAQVIARLDNGEPVMWQKPIDKGQLLIWGTSWRPGDSQFALSKKFPAIFTLILEEFADVRRPVTQHFVDDTLTLEPGARIRLPNGAEQVVGNEEPLLTPTEPGIYRVLGAKNQAIAVNLHPDESDTEPIDVDMLQRRGVRIGGRESNASEEERLRQKRDKELEQSQKLWRYLILATVVILLVETGIAGRLSRRQTSVESEENL